MMEKIRRPILMILLGLMPGPWARAAGTPGLVSEIASQSCVLKTQTESALQSFGTRVNGGTATDRATIASALNTLSVRSGGALDKDLKNIRFDIGNVIGGGGKQLAGRQTASAIQLSPIIMGRRSSTRAAAEATVTHEIAHRIANRHGLYPKYSRSAPECHISMYCTHRVGADGSAGASQSTRNEEFAEVLTAYIFHAQELKARCPASYDFMKKNLFAGNDAPASCGSAAFARSYQGMDGSQRPLSGDSTAPGGYTLYTNTNSAAQPAYLPLQQLMTQLQENRAQDQASKKKKGPRTQPAPSSGKSRVAPEWTPPLH
jgi:hypothetical protein